MLYMIIEHFRGGDPVPVYRRFRDKGRMAPEGLRYVSSWVTEDLGRCLSGDGVRRSGAPRAMGGALERSRGDGNPSRGHLGGGGGRRGSPAVSPRP